MDSRRPYSAGGSDDPKEPESPKEEDPMQELVRFIAQHLVDNPAQVSVTEVSSGQTMILELRVETADIGQVIGREGRMAEALRVIVHAASRKQGRTAVLEIFDGRGSRKTFAAPIILRAARGPERSPVSFHAPQAVQKA
jgi:hypothetical protein